MTMRDEPLTAEDTKKLNLSETLQKAAEGQQAKTQQASDLQDVGLEPTPDETNDLPSWALPLPDGVVLPKGRQIYAMRFRAKLTDTPKMGDRYCLLWSLTEADEKFAYGRVRNVPAMTMNELSKQMIRVFGFVRVSETGKEHADGSAAAPDWAETNGQKILAFWNDIGAKCRTQVKNGYAKLHTMEVDEVIDFFTKCVAVRTVVG